MGNQKPAEPVAPAQPADLGVCPQPQIGGGRSVPDGSQALAAGGSGTGASPRLLGRGAGYWIPRLVMAALALVLALLAMEWLARRPRPAGTWHYPLEMWKYARQLKQASADPAVGHEHRGGHSAELMGVTIQINSAGLRGPEITLEKPSGTRRLLVLGDSVTLGWGVREDETYARRLEAELARRLPQDSQWQVLNAGVGNYNTPQEVAWLERYGWPLAPDLVLLGYFINDAEVYRPPSQNWLARHSYLFVLAESAADGLLRRAGTRPDWQAHYAGLYRADAPGWQATAKALARLGAQCQAHGVPLVVAIIPELHRLGSEYPFGEIHRQVGQEALRAGARVIDLTDAIGQGSPREYWVSPGDAHPNGRAHALLAKALAGPVAEIVESLPPQ